LTDFELAAEIYRRVRRSGHTPRSSADCLIAAVCIRANVPLLHDDIDFDRIADGSDLTVA
jgi:predicted nucleic acid-binding protein